MLQITAPYMLSSLRLPAAATWKRSQSETLTTLSFGAAKPDELMTQEPKWTRNSREVDLETTFAHLIMWWMRTQYAPTLPSNTLTGTNVDDLRGRVNQSIEKEKPGFTTLLQEDITSFTQRFEGNMIRKALKQLQDNNLATISNRTRGSGGYSFELTLTQQGLALTLDPLETMLLKNISWTRRCELTLLNRIKQKHSGYRTGQTIPNPIEIDGQIMPRYVRQFALKHLAEQGIVRAVYKKAQKGNATGGNWVYKVVNPNSMANQPVGMNYARSALLGLLHYLATDPARLTCGASLPSNELLANTYGKTINSIPAAKNKLIEAGWIEQVNQREYRIRRTPSNQEVTNVIKTQLGELHRSLESLLLNVSNKLKRTIWADRTELQQLVSFPDHVTEAGKKPKMTLLIQDMETAPVPLILGDHSTCPLKTRLNPAIDYDVLKHTLTQINDNPAQLAQGAQFGIPAWQFPALYEPQIKAKPTFKLTPHQAHFDLNYGLTSTRPDSANAFTPMHQINPMTLPIGFSNTFSQIDRHRYAQAFLKMTQHVFPHPDLEQLYEQDHITLTPNQADVFRKLKTPFEAIGLQMAV